MERKAISPDNGAWLLQCQAEDSEIHVVTLTRIIVDEVYLETYYHTFRVITLDSPSQLNVQRETAVGFHYVYLLAL